MSLMKSRGVHEIKEAAMPDGNVGNRKHESNLKLTRIVASSGTHQADQRTERGWGSVYCGTQYARLVMTLAAFIGTVRKRECDKRICTHQTTISFNHDHGQYTPQYSLNYPCCHFRMLGHFFLIHYDLSTNHLRRCNSLVVVVGPDQPGNG
ncbi:hypothetical protein N658DRAFT_287754 [Parathielavia hyrcaniae]|uniref:Uncharacterized protein n=1 Tax=Parathielavia hyrcaniae TaxID=113614 RepID=A0AAN6SY00_9PEZI|nr:hypothetical protein N658DRAFT_287754 [Parathielavia hyrcaniae]